MLPRKLTAVCFAGEIAEETVSNLMSSDEKGDKGPLGGILSQDEDKKDSGDGEWFQSTSDHVN